MTAGVIVAVVVLLTGTALGLWRRRGEGRFHPPKPTPPAPPATRSPLSAAPTPRSSAAPSLAASASPSPSTPLETADHIAEPEPSGRTIDPALLAQLGAGEPARATLLQFSSAFCAPCRAVRRISSEVAAMVPGVRHVEVDAESHLDAVRALDIWRTPTLLLLDTHGREVRRATGVPTKPHLIAALAEAVESAPDHR